MDFPTEITYKILLSLTSKEILNYCEAYPKSKSICDDKYFWLIKLDQDFITTGTDGQVRIPSQYAKMYENIGEKGVDMYNRWYLENNLDTFKLNLNIDNDDIIVFKLDIGNYDKDVLINSFVNKLFDKGRIRVLDKLLNMSRNMNIDIDFTEYFWDAMRSESARSLEWLEQHNFLGVSYDEFAEYNEDFHSLNPDVALWLAYHKYLRYDIAMGIIASNTEQIIDVEKIHAQGILPDQEDINNLAEHGQLNKLKKFASYGIIPNAGAFRGITKNGYILVLQWLDSLGIHPNELVMNIAAQKGYINILEWLYDKGMFPNIDFNTDRYTQEWMIQKGIISE